jgi:hypothetical protein
MWVWTDGEELINLETGSRIYVVAREIHFGFPGAQDVALASCKSEEEVGEKLSVILKGVHIGADFRKASREFPSLKKNEPMHD